MANRPDDYWPGLGLILGVGIGATIGLLAQPEVFYLYAAFGAGIGIIAGAAMRALSRR